MLWVGVHLPALSLESFSGLLGAAADGQPVALVEQHRMVAVNEVAREMGVSPGMKRATAQALAPDLVCGVADAGRDAQALRAVAHVLLAFSPCVTLVPPGAVLVEVLPSLRCFGGPARLWQRLREALAPLGHRLQMAHAPSAQAAWLLACRQDHPAPPVAWTQAALAAQSPPALSSAPRQAPAQPGVAMPLDAAWAEARRQLAALPVDLLVADATALANLQAMGLHTLGDLRRQPRGGLARRFGVALVNDLDRAWGDAPDPRAWVDLPLRFDSRVDLWARADNTEALLGGAAILLTRLLAWAQARHARILGFQLVLQHETRLRAGAHGEAGPHTSALEIALAEPTGDARHLQALLRERLARSPLAAPVLAMGLRCDHPVLGPPPDGQLFPSATGQREGLLRLIERLQARLGPERIRRLGERPDHRPELAAGREPATRLAVLPAQQARAQAPAAAAATLAGAAAMASRESRRVTRPMWLLGTPQALAERHSQPCRGHQPLRLLTGAERIEAGWWDGGLVARDYFIAQAPEGELLWIYRLRPAPPAGEPGWFLHGLFG